MKKILLLSVFFIFASLATVSAQTTIGVIGTYGFSDLTLSFDDLEFEIGANLNKQLNISADFTILGDDLSLGDTKGFFWSVSLGAYVNLGIRYRL